jgi:hypothetical protein
MSWTCGVGPCHWSGTTRLWESALGVHLAGSVASGRAYGSEFCGLIWP